MSFLKKIALFLAGFQVGHTLNHVLLYYSGILPLEILGWTITPALNISAILFNGLTVVLLFWYLLRK